MRRREVFQAAAVLGLLAGGCATGADRISFDRGEFALVYARLMTTGLALLEGAIDAAKKRAKGAASTTVDSLTQYRQALLDVQKRVDDAIISAPAQQQQASAQGLADLGRALAQAIPLILPLIAAAGG